MQNSNSALNLYAKIEDLIGVKEVAPKLYEYYFDILKDMKFNSLLDIGCGKGDFLKELKSRYNVEVLGIDKSSKMVEFAKNNSVNAKVAEIFDIDKKFDIATAVFDMLNYLEPKEFISFFKHLKKITKYFIFDLNTLYGLSELAVGAYINEDDKRFLAIDSYYENGIHESEFILFEKDKNCYKKTNATIFQYYYPGDFVKLLEGWEMVKKVDIKLYDMSDFDKTLYLLKATN
jgi:SAM-dependent methyltransferase